MLIIMDGHLTIFLGMSGLSIVFLNLTSYLIKYSNRRMPNLYTFTVLKTVEECLRDILCEEQTCNHDASK